MNETKKNMELRIDKITFEHVDISTKERWPALMTRGVAKCHYTVDLPDGPASFARDILVADGIIDLSAIVSDIKTQVKQAVK